MLRCDRCLVDPGLECPGEHAPFLCLKPGFREHFVTLAREEAEKERAGPSLLRKVANLTGAVVHHVATGAHRVDEATHEMRLAKCQACPGGFWRSSDETCQHPTCGCFMQIKAYMAEKRCPLGEWEAVTSPP